MSTCQTEHGSVLCPCCGSLLAEGQDVWHHRCLRCGYESAQFANAINSPAATLSEPHREEGLRVLRESNFRDLLGRMEALLSVRHQSLLEVGCGHGWFLELAARRFAVTGIEPDHGIFLTAKARGVNVVEGYFPQALNPTARFDVIVFNDVFEHIPDPQATLRACVSQMNGGGLIVLSLPASDGIFYRVASLAKRIGLGGPFARLWQKGFPSPHLHYFSPANLELLLQHCGLQTVSVSRLPSVRLQGLYSRIAYGDPRRWLRHGLVWLAIVLLYPLLKWLPSDALVVMATPVVALPSE